MRQKHGALIGLILGCLWSTHLWAASPEPVHSNKGMIATSHQLATQTGLRILRKGGNAMDAAVAIGYALSVVHPCCGNIGGGGFMLYRTQQGKVHFINFREKAPANIQAKDFLDKQGKKQSDKMYQGYLAVGVPGTVKGLEYAREHYGTMKREQLIDPAIELAQQGFKLTQAGAKLISRYAQYFKKYPETKQLFLKNGQPYHAGDKFKQPQLAHSLKLIAQQGDHAFYQGQLAHAMVDAIQKHGGVMALSDLHNYQVSEAQPIQCHYHGHTIYSAPPPSSGGVVICQAMNILKPYPLSFLGFHSSRAAHYVLEAERFAFADRNNYLGDPDFVANPIKQLLSDEHINQIQKQIQPFQATDSRAIKPAISINQEGANTTHYTVVDQNGNAVAVTYTLNNMFGAKVLAGDTGIILNNELNDFVIKPGSKDGFGLVEGKTNALAPNKQPLSSMAPTIVTQNGHLSMALGSPGGPTIITTIIQNIINYLDYHMDLQAAIDAPRYHMQWLPDQVYMEPRCFSMDTQRRLQAMGYKLHPGSIYGTQHWGATTAVSYNPKTQQFIGAVDSRRSQGLAAGPATHQTKP